MEDTQKENKYIPGQIFKFPLNKTSCKTPFSSLRLGFQIMADICQILLFFWARSHYGNQHLVRVSIHYTTDFCQHRKQRKSWRSAEVEINEFTFAELTEASPGKMNPVAQSYIPAQMHGSQSMIHSKNTLKIENRFLIKSSTCVKTQNCLLCSLWL